MGAAGCGLQRSLAKFIPRQPVWVRKSPKKLAANNNRYTVYQLQLSVATSLCSAGDMYMMKVCVSLT